MDPRAKQAERIVAKPAGVTILPNELERSQTRLGQEAAPSLGSTPLPAFKVFPNVVNYPTGHEQLTLGAAPSLQGARPDFKPTPGAINIPHGDEQVTIRRRST